MHLRNRSIHLTAVAVACAAACGGGSYAYVPEGATLRADGRPVTRIAIPPEQPRGEVRVESMGITSLDGRSDRKIDVIHLRLAVGNDSDDRPWTIDTREQLLEIPGEGRSQAIFVSSDRDSMPIVQVPRRDRRVLDLFFPLPATVDDEDDLAGFELLWQVNTGDRVVAQRTPFGRVSTEPPVQYSGSIYTGWGPYWWHDPFYSRHVFIHHRPIVIRDTGRVIVTRPRGHFRVRDHRRR
jgi:hypothetical protein